MIDPPKATKGRRMSKKTRKKSPKSSAGKRTRAQSATSAKGPPSKSRGTTASKPGKNAKHRQTGNAVSKASHKPASKALNLSSEGKSIQRTAAGSKASANPSAQKAGAPAAARPALTEGAKAPSFRLPRDGGSTVSLGDFAGRKLVLFFYPRADTPGCTREAIDFTRLMSAFAVNQTSVLGVSGDPPKAQEAFRNKHDLSIPLVSDEQHEMLQAYGAWGEKSMYGRTFQGILRTTVLIGTDGRIVRIWRNVRVDGHADEVLAAAKAT
jgi:thioredoxin-dependent peroxiredoxin